MNAQKIEVIRFVGSGNSKRAATNEFKISSSTINSYKHNKECLIKLADDPYTMDRCKKLEKQK